MQLVAYGAQDFYLTGNAQITYFKVVYRRHTNFATESVEQTFNGSATFGGKAVCNIQRSGDLITKMYLNTKLSGPKTGNWAWVSRVGHALIQDVTLDIGGTTVDKQYNDWLNVWYELARNHAHDRGYDKMIGNTQEHTTIAVGEKSVNVWVPLQFACCRNDGLALPVIALQYHDIKISFTFERLERLVNREASFASVSSSDFKMEAASLFVDYVYLDDEERKKFAQASHEYLFEQLQFSGAESLASVNNKIRLNLNHPCKELVWVTKCEKYISGGRFLAYNASNPEEGRLLATKRFALKCAKYDVAGNLLELDSTTNKLKSHASVSADNQTLFDKIGAVSTSVTPDADALIITGELLPWEECSKLMSVFKFDDHSPTKGDGAASKDVIIYQHDNYGVLLNGSVNPTQQVLLQLNSHDRLSKRGGEYFNYVQPYQCHTNTPVDGVNVLSFALNPEEHQPSGTCNMSRIDNATLSLTIDGKIVGTNGQSSVYIFATNYNVLRIMSGMAGLAYSN